MRRIVAASARIETVVVSTTKLIDRRLAQPPLQRVFVLLLASWLHCRNNRKVSGKLIRRKRLDIHFDQAHERAAKVRFLLTAAVYDHAGRGNNSAVSFYDVDCLLHAPAAGHHIFSNDEAFSFFDDESTAQDQSAIFFFDKDVAFA